MPLAKEAIVAKGRESFLPPRKVIRPGAGESEKSSGPNSRRASQPVPSGIAAGSVNGIAPKVSNLFQAARAAVGKERERREEKGERAAHFNNQNTNSNSTSTSLT